VPLPSDMPKSQGAVEDARTSSPLPPARESTRKPTAIARTTGHAGAGWIGHTRRGARKGVERVGAGRAVRDSCGVAGNAKAPVSDDGQSEGDAASERDRHGVLANERLTGALGAVLLVLFAVEGLTVVLHVHSTLPAHVFIGMLLVPPVLVKIATTGHRFSRYYLGDPAYVDRGPPMWLLRLVGPFVVLTSAAVLATGIADTVLDPVPRWADLGHKASFVLWFGCMTIHVLGHLRKTPSLATADWRHDHPVPGRGRRVAIIGTTLCVGLLLGVWSMGWHLPTPRG